MNKRTRYSPEVRERAVRGGSVAAKVLHDIESLELRELEVGEQLPVIELLMRTPNEDWKSKILDNN